MEDNHRRFVALAIADVADGEGKTRERLVGPLANAVEYLAGRQPALRTALGMLGRGRFGRERVLVEVETTLQPGPAIDVQVHGPVAPFVRAKLVAGIQELLNRHPRPLRTKEGQYSFTIYQPPLPSLAGLKVLGNVAIGRWTSGRPRITTATLQVTARCQADCYHCSAAKHRDRAKEELTTQEWQRVIRETEQLGVVNVVFTGGEPLLRPDIYELIAWVDPDEATSMLFTNGLLLDGERVARLRDAGLYGLNVSIDSPDPSQHDALRRVPGCFAKAMEGISRVREAGMLVGISTYATPERLQSGEIKRLVELGREMGVHEITIFDTVPTGKLLHQERHRLLSELDKQQLIELEQQLNATPGYPHIITQAKINGPTGTGCFAGWYQFYLTAYGDVMPCDFTPLTFGSARREPLSVIWDRLISHDAYRDPCNHCRMQDPEFRAAYIDRIPDEGPFPYPVQLLEQAPAQQPEPVGASAP